MLDTTQPYADIIINALCTYLWEQDYGDILVINGQEVVYSDPYGYFDYDAVLKEGFARNFHSEEDLEFSPDLKKAIRDRHNTLMAAEAKRNVTSITHVPTSPYMN